jgi:hypothetical protein
MLGCPTPKPGNLTDGQCVVLLVVLQRRWGKGLKSVLEGFLEASVACFFVICVLFIEGAVGGTGALWARDFALEGGERLDELSRDGLLLLGSEAETGCHSQSRGHSSYLSIKGLRRRGERRVRVWRGELKRTFVTGRHGGTGCTGVYVASTMN